MRRIFRTYNKYGNKPTYVDGIRFASKREAARYRELKLLSRDYTIKDLKLQPKFELQPAFEKKGEKYKAINYIADFSYVENEKQIVEDCKGFKKDKVFLLKRKLFECKYPNLTIKIV